MDKKRKILFVGEASHIATGFGTYWNEVLKRLYSTGEFEIAELGSYAHDGDPNNQRVPWKFYPVGPNRNDKEAMNAYHSTRTNQFGEARFSDVCLDFKPDIICAIRDWWMDEFILRSPLRKNFTFVWMPTIDGSPQKDTWLDSYKQCNYVLTYSEWGMDVLKKEGRPGTNLVAVASPGADLEVFTPVLDKATHRKKLGLREDALIIGTIMRNQKRKLYYDLIEAFAKWIYKAKTKGHTELAKRTFLYLHTSFPDVGYNIGRAVKEFKLGNKVIMTYICTNCHAAYPAFFAGATANCHRCGAPAAHPPNATLHCPRNILADIVNAFDLYVQYSICLHPDTPIMTSDGWNNIGNIAVGDKVIGKDGKLHRVYKTIRSRPDKCLNISVKGRPWSVTATDNHPWLVVDRPGLSKGIESIVNRERYHKNRGTKCPKLKFIYKRTDELQPGDLLANRIPAEIILPDYDLPFMDEDMAYYLGLFAANGHANETCGQCTITSHSAEKENVFVIAQKIAQQFNKTAKQQQVNNRDAVITNICDTKFRNILRQVCYHEDKSKQLPYGCHLWPKKLQEALIRGLMFGDGYQKKEYLNIYCTTSVHIAKVVGSILERLNWYYSCSTQYRDNKLPMYRFEIRTDGERTSHETLYRDGFVLAKVASSNQSNFDDDVITIDVEDDHNYNTICGMSHNCEGWGMPLTEAQACGVPTMAVRYSAMEDHLLNPGSVPIEVGRFFYEPMIETEQRRALPDNQDFVRKLDIFLRLSKAKREELGKKTRQHVEELVETYGQDKKMARRGWDRTAAIWGNLLRTCEIKDQNQTWLYPEPRIHKPDFRPPRQNMNNTEFVRWVISSIWHRPELTKSYYASEWIDALNVGYKLEGEQRVAMDRNKLVEYFAQMVHHENLMEEKRVLSLQNISPDQIGLVAI